MPFSLPERKAQSIRAAELFPGGPGRFPFPARVSFLPDLSRELRARLEENGLPVDARGALPTVAGRNASALCGARFFHPIMDHQKFDDATDAILARDPRFDRAAYYFLRDALDYTLKQRKKASGTQGHITGQQLLEGLRQHALKTFGPMVPTVFEYWGVKGTVDFGSMVFNLVDAGIFGKTDADTLEDFKNIYTFHDAFVAPFQPRSPLPPMRKITVETPARELN